MGIWRAATPWSMSPRPALVRAAAWIDLDRSLRTASGSSPTTPPARMDRLTLPLDIFFHSAPMFSITLYHCESVRRSGSRSSESARHRANNHCLPHVSSLFLFRLYPEE